MPVNTPRKDYADMTPKWKRLRDCYAGRDAVLKAGAAYCPDLPGQDAAGNAAYRARGNFYNATARTAQGLAGAIFAKAPEVEFPESLKEILKDVTLSGVTFEMFAGDAARDVMLVGRYGVLVDYPATAQGPDGRPYCVGYPAEDIINWRSERRGGDDELTMVVLREDYDATPEGGDEFAYACGVQYRVLRLNGGAATSETWREKPSLMGLAKEYVLVEGSRVALTRRGVPLEFIPFTFIGSLHATPDIEEPPLLAVADINLAHWRNSVDHEYGLHLVALPTPWVSGSKGPKDGPVKFGPSVLLELDVQGQAGMLEFSGAGLSSIVAAMLDKQKQMSSLGARLMEEPTRGDTATAVLVRHSGEHASLATVAGSVEQGFSRALQFMGWWSGVGEKPADVPANVELNKEYTDVQASPQEIQVALTALQAGEISFETWWNLITKGGWGREGVDADAERKAIDDAKALAPEPPLDPALSPRAAAAARGAGGAGGVKPVNVPKAKTPYGGAN